MKKKLLLLFCLLVTAGSAAWAEIAHGECKNGSWVIDDSGKLTVNINGDMADYSSIDDVPWYKYRNRITAIHIGSGCTNIGRSAFHLLENVTSVTGGENVEACAKYSFAYCGRDGKGIPLISFPKCDYVGEGAFDDASVVNFSLPLVETYKQFSLDSNPRVCLMADLGSKVEMLKAASMRGPKYVFIQSPTPPDWERLGKWPNALYVEDFYCYPFRENTIVIVPNEYLNTYINYYPKKHPEVEEGYMSCYYLDGDCSEYKNRDKAQTGKIYAGGPIYDEGKFVGGWYVDDDNFLRVVLTTDKMPAFDSFDSSPFVHALGDGAPWKSVLGNVDEMMIEYVGNKSDITFTIPDYCFNSGLLRDIYDIYLKNIDRLVIGREAFQSCEQLVGIYDWDVFMNGANENMNVTIGDKAFLDCTNLEYLFGMNINSLGSHAFENCRSFILDDAWVHFNANYIPESAFENCQSLYHNGYFDFSGVEVIGPYAFRMSGIREFDLSNVKSVGDYAFASSDIVKLSFGGSTMNCNFGSHCFASCPDLTDVFVSEPIKYGFPSDIFSDYRLSDVTLHCEAELYRQYYENHPVFGKMKVDKEFTFPVNGSVGDGTWTLASSGTLSINCSSIPDYSYYREQPWDAYREYIKYIHLRNSQTIGKNAFSELPNLGNVSISLNCREIHDEAFKNCPKLIAINTPVVETLGNNVFEGCTNLEVIQLGKNLTTVGNYVFKNCQSLKTIENRASTPATTTRYSFSSIKSDGQASIDLSVPDVYVTKYITDPNWSKFHIPYTDERGTWTKAGNIGDGMWIIYTDSTMVFSSERNLTDEEAAQLQTDFGRGIGYMPTDPRALTKRIEFVGDLSEVPQSFQQFPNLESVKLCPSIKKINQMAFFDCPKLGSVNLQSVDIIERYAFEKTAFETIDLTNVKDIQSAAFSRCENLKTAKLGPVCKLGSYVFNQCSNLMDVDLSSADIENAAGCFSGCSSLKAVTANATVLSSGLFRNCTALETVSLGSKLESIAYDSFEGCTGLRYIYINRATPPALPKGERPIIIADTQVGTEDIWAFDGLTRSNIHLIVPPDFVAAYKAADIWKDMTIESNNEIVEPALPTGGSIGQNGTWYLGTDGTLVVDVSGDIPATDSEGKPWCETFNAWVSLIKEVIFTDNVKSIPDNFFGGTYFADVSAGVETVTLGRFLKSVGKKSLSFSGIKDVYVYSENLLEMQSNTFNLDAAAKNNATLHILKTSDGYYYAANSATSRFHIAADLDTNEMMKCGTLGTQGYWTFVDGVLTVNYNGAMPTLTSRTDHIDDPETAYRFKWIDFLSEIEEIVITGKDVEIQPYFLYYEGEGTSDGQHPDDHIKTVTLGSGVKSLGRASLSLYELKRVNCYGVNAPTLPATISSNYKAFWAKRITANRAFLWTVPNASTDYALINSEWATFNHSAHKLNPYDMPTQETLADFETGKLNQIPFISEGDYPWDITGEDAESGSFSMRSGNKGVANSSSTISAMYLFDTNGYIYFMAKCMGEGSGSGWDKCIFYIDGEQQFSYGTLGDVWGSYIFPVKAGMHTFKWEYTKDGSVDAPGDGFFVDNINFLQEGQDNDLITGLEDLKDLRDSKDFKDSWFDLSGRKLTGKPVQPGLYINGGRKVVIK